MASSPVAQVGQAGAAELLQLLLPRTGDLVQGAWASIILRSRSEPLSLSIQLSGRHANTVGYNDFAVISMAMAALMASKLCGSVTCRATPPQVLPWNLLNVGEK